MREKKLTYRLVLLACIVFFCSLPQRAGAMDVRYDEQQYEVVIREDFYVGLYIEEEGQEELDDFEITLHYDENFLEYVQGGTSGGDGEVTIRDETAVKNVRNLLIFRSLAGGRTTITIEKASGHDEDGKQIEPVRKENASVRIEMLEEARITELSVNGKELEEFKPQKSVYNLNVSRDVTRLKIDAKLENEDSSLEITGNRLAVGENTVYLTVRGENGSNIYTLHVNREKTPASPSVSAERTEEREATEDSDSILFFMLCVTAILLAGLLLIVLIRKKRRSTRRKLLQEKTQKEISGPVVPKRAKGRIADKSEYLGRKPVISVRDVCMYFKISTQNVSGIKEFAVQKMKGNIRYRELKALDHINFHVYAGEVVGIIGTNGSGKSTLLKIVSGALKPTSGKVVVEKNKVQLLTLGTGFDMELTARENVYLNGAIIGYSKKFIDEKFDEIVAFAELEGFMDEKVKNFSSGMVSRLGFAIATIEDAPEILILDEVLSVGDEFFRKKSLARIKEMIHGGSTVLLVSHSMSTIRDNCSKVVWIEKGKLRMIGSPEDVCNAYSHQNEIV